MLFNYTFSKPFPPTEIFHFPELITIKVSNCSNKLNVTNKAGKYQVQNFKLLLLIKLLSLFKLISMSVY